MMQQHARYAGTRPSLIFKRETFPTFCFKRLQRVRWSSSRRAAPSAMCGLTPPHLQRPTKCGTLSYCKSY